MSEFANSRPSSDRVTPITRSRKSSCAVVIYRYDQTDIAKILNLNATNDQQLANTASSSTSGNLQARSRLVVRQDIIRCTFQNAKGSSSGSFSLTLKRGKQVKGGANQESNIDYAEAVNAGDWIMIYAKRSNEISDSDINSTSAKSGFKFLGIIESVRLSEVDDPSSGTPRLEYTISGKSFGKVFESSIFFNPIVNKQALETALGVDFLKDSSNALKPIRDNTADNVIKRLTEFYLGAKLASRSAANEAWYIPQALASMFKGTRDKKLGKAFVDILDLTKIGLHKYQNNTFKRADTLSFGSAFVSSLPSSGTIWSTLQFLQNAAVNELYTELVKGSDGRLKPGLILRQIPFSNKENHETNILAAHKKATGQSLTDSVRTSEKTYFVDLPYTSIVSSDIRQKNIGKSDHERINYAIVTPRLTKAFDIAFVAASNAPSVQRYGLKTFQTQTSYVFSTSAVTEFDLKTTCQKCVDLIKDWFFLGHNLYSGTIVTDGMDDFVEVGSNLFISDIKQLFHIEAYAYTWEIAPGGNVNYVTEFRVSRGQRYNNSKASFIGTSAIANEPTTIVTSFVKREGK